MGSLLNILWGNLCFDWFWSKPFIHMKLYGFCIDERKIYFVFRPTLDHQQVTYQLLTYLTSSRLPHHQSLYCLLTTTWPPRNNLVTAMNTFACLLASSPKPLDDLLLPSHHSASHPPIGQCLTASFMSFELFMCPVKKIAITFRIWLCSKKVNCKQFVKKL